MPFERGEILFSKGFFDFTDIRKLQDKAKTSYTLSTLTFTPDLRNVRPPEEPAKSEPATLDLESLVEQLQKSPELASALAALIAAQAPAK